MVVRHSIYRACAILFMKPIVSVIMPVFNAEKYIEDAIDSLLAQTFTNFELIIINDGSTDYSESLIFRYRDKRIRYIRHSANLGLIAALNEGIRHASGEFIARLDADDVANPNRLFKQVQFLLRNPDHSICGSSYQVINAKGQKLYNVSLPTSDRQIRTLLFFGNCICHSSVMFRTSSLDKELYRSTYTLCEDYDLWRRLIEWNKVAVLPEPLINYRLHGMNVSVTKRMEMLRNAGRIYAHFLEKSGLSYTQDDFLLHHAFLSYNVVYIRQVGFDKLEKWILKLEKMFSYHEQSDRWIAGKVMIRRWLAFCIKSREYKRLINNPFITVHIRQYISCFVAKLFDNVLGRKNAFDF